MLDGKRVAVVVPAHDEEKLIAETVGSIPDFVDRILVVDDASRDRTAEVVRGLTDPRVELIEHERNLGVGAAILSGYRRALEERLDVDRIYQRYGFPNDMLVHLNVWNARVRDYPSRPIYGVGERSGIRLRKVVPTISWLLMKGFFWRLREKYVIRDFHPLVFFYLLGLVMGLLGLGLGIAEVVLRIMGNQITAATVVLVALLLIFGSQFALFAMWFDMESNKDLR